MSLRTLARKQGIKFNIRYEYSTVGTGAQLTKVWKMRYHNVMGILVPLTRRTEMLYFDRQKVFAEFVLKIPMQGLVDFSAISTRDRIFKGSRTFLIELKKNWGEQDKYLILALTEVTDD